MGTSSLSTTSVGDIFNAIVSTSANTIDANFTNLWSLFGIFIGFVILIVLWKGLKYAFKQLK